jgi:outer membrane protein assembly factor BamD
MRKRHILGALLGFAILAGLATNSNAQLIKKPGAKKQQPSKADANSSVQPDKILYDRALDDIKHARYTEGRLALQTLINTYPDSEYLAKAKLAVADSYYKEGGTSNLTQAVAEYKDFITFFPFLDESAYAQMQVGMAHYKMMEKSDRDSSQAQMAEDEFQAMLLKYPQSTYASQAEQRLREVQEVLADGEYKIAHYYYTKQDYRASAARLMEVTSRYPLYSQSDEALWLLGDIYTRVKQGSKNEDQRNYWSVASARVYATIAQQYPLSPRAPEAKARLKQMGMPIPAPNPEALARMQKEQQYEKEHHQSAILKTPKGMLRGAPDVSVAAHVGQPNLNPPDDAVAASEVLKPNAAGVGFISGSTAGGSGDSSTGGTGQSSNAPSTQEDATPVDRGVVESGPGSGTTFGVQIIQPNGVNAPKASDTAPANATNPPAAGATEQPNPPSSSPQPSANPSDGPAASSSTSAPTGSNAQPTAAQPAAQSDQSSSSDSSSSAANSQAPASSSSADDSKDSSSKKKKGIKKLVPW